MKRYNVEISCMIPAEDGDYVLWDDVERAIMSLESEVNCRWQHGAAGSGHLQYVERRLKAIRMPNVDHLDDKGCCCGRKPIQYKRDSRLLCDRCDRAFNIDTGKQIENWAWMRRGDGFVLRCSVCRKREGVMREWQGFPAGQQCKECYAKNVKKYESRTVANGPVIKNLCYACRREIPNEPPGMYTLQGNDYCESCADAIH